MDMFDGEPQLGLLPRWVGKAAAWGVFLGIAFVPVARGLVFDQATSRVMNEIEPIMGDLLTRVDPPSAAPSD